MWLPQRQGYCLSMGMRSWLVALSAETRASPRSNCLGFEQLNHLRINGIFAL